MPAIFVHGVPDTHRLWDTVIARLARDDTVALSLPGFDSDVPAGFNASKESYVDWLISELEQIGEPVDLVGHDWGAILTYRVASLRPDLIRTWAAGGGPLDSTYVWHETAQLWQTPEVGEQVMTAFVPDALVPGFVGYGIPEEYAKVSSQLIDDRMKDCILRLYRSAVNVGAEWERDLSDARPALIIFGDYDPFVPANFGQVLADRVGGRFVALPECGHWWPVQRPDETAQLLEEHWTKHAR